MTSPSTDDVSDQPDGRPTTVTLAVVAVAGAAIVCALRWAIERDGAVVAADRRVLELVLGWRDGALTLAFRSVTLLGDMWAVVGVGLVGVVALVKRGRRDLAVVVVASSAGTWLLIHWIKIAVHRLRPPDAVRLVDAGGFSFPSGHAGQAAAMYFALGVVVASTLGGRRSRRAAVAAGVVVALSIGSSRVYLGVHLLSDVVAGWALGVAWFAVLLAVAGLRRRRSGVGELTAP